MASTYDWKKYDSSTDAEYQDNLKKAEAILNGDIQSDKTKGYESSYNGLISQGMTPGEKTNGYDAALKAHGNSYADPNGYGKKQTDYMTAYENHINKPFRYDLNGDALYQQYKDQFMRQGRLAMQDTMGQAAALTGGYGNSYAQTAGNQAYQSYLMQLNDVIPQLEQMAYERYNQKGQNYANLSAMYGSMNDAERAAWESQYNRLYGAYRDSYGDDMTKYRMQVSALSDMLNNSWNDDRTRYSTGVNYYGNAAENARAFNYQKLQDENQQGFTDWQLLNSGSAGYGYKPVQQDNPKKDLTPEYSQRVLNIIKTSSNLSAKNAKAHIDDALNDGKITEGEAITLYKYYGVY